MSRVALLHPAAADAKRRARTLRSAGHTVRAVALGRTSDLRPLLAVPPEAFIIDLDRAPSLGRDTALYLRQRKTTRRVPIVFTGGEPEFVERVRELLPDTTFATWRGIRGALRRALASAPARPVVRGALAGYSGTPLAKKLGIKTGTRVALLAAPRDFTAKLAPLPPEIRLQTNTRSRPDLVLLFARSRAELGRRFPSVSRALAEGGGLWIAWPKQASGVSTDLTQKEIREFGLERGFVDYKICAIDETWSGLKFARRRGHRRSRQSP